MQGYISPAGVITRNDHQRTIRGLALTQLIIGGLTFILGIIAAVLGIWIYSLAQGIWGGIWILVTGIIGVISSKKSNNGCCLGGTYMAFSIVSTVVASINIIMLGTGIAYFGGSYCHDHKRCFDENSQVLGLYIPTLILIITEFFISIVAAVYSCKSSTCCCCAQQQQQHFVIQTQQHPYQMLTNQSYLVVVASSHPDYQPQHAGYPQQVGVATTIPAQTYSTQMISQPQEEQQMVSSQCNQGAVNPLVVSLQNTGAMYLSSQGQPIAGHTSIVYSGQATAQVPNNAAPPPYNQFNEETKNPAGPLSC